MTAAPEDEESEADMRVRYPLSVLDQKSQSGSTYLVEIIYTSTRRKIDDDFL